MSISAFQNALHDNDVFKAQQIIENIEYFTSLHDYLLHDAISSGNTSIIDILLEKGNCDINERNSTGDTPLHLAVRQLYESQAQIWVEIIFKMLEKGAYIGYQNNEGNTPVHTAFLSGLATGEIMDSLLRLYVKMFDVCVPSCSVNEEGLSIFHIACTRGESYVLQKLVDYKIHGEMDRVSLDSKSGYAGYTPLHFAVAGRQHEVVKVLLDGGVDAYATDVNGSTPLHLALRMADGEMIDLLLPYCWDERVDKLGYTHFMSACTYNDATFVEQYLNASPTISINNQVRSIDGLPFAGYSPLHFAVACCNHEVIEILLQHINIDIYARDNNGSTPLHLALYNRDRFIIDRLLLKDSTLENVVDNFGVSHFMSACASNEPQFVKEFLRVSEIHQSPLPQTLINAKVNELAAFYAGYSPLHFAVEFENYEIAKILLDSGADIYAQNVDGSTPLHLALKLENVWMIDLILPYDGMKDNIVNDAGLSHFMSACIGSKVSIVEEYLEAADIWPWSSSSQLINSSTTNSDIWCAGYSPLHFASEFGRIDTVKLLLSYNADCCKLSSRKLTPLMLAQQYKHDKVCRLLQQHCEAYHWYKDVMLRQMYIDISSESDEGKSEKGMIDFNGNKMDFEVFQK